MPSRGCVLSLLLLSVCFSEAAESTTGEWRKWPAVEPTTATGPGRSRGCIACLPAVSRSIATGFGDPDELSAVCVGVAGVRDNGGVVSSFSSDFTFVFRLAPGAESSAPSGWWRLPPQTFAPAGLSPGLGFASCGVLSLPQPQPGLIPGGRNASLVLVVSGGANSGSWTGSSNGKSFALPLTARQRFDAGTPAAAPVVAGSWVELSLMDDVIRRGAFFGTGMGQTAGVHDFFAVWAGRVGNGGSGADSNAMSTVRADAFSGTWGDIAWDPITQSGDVPSARAFGVMSKIGSGSPGSTSDRFDRFVVAGGSNTASSTYFSAVYRCQVDPVAKTANWVLLAADQPVPMQPTAVAPCPRASFAASVFPYSNAVWLGIGYRYCNPSSVGIAEDMWTWKPIMGWQRVNATGQVLSPPRSEVGHFRAEVGSRVLFGVYGGTFASGADKEELHTLDMGPIRVVGPATTGLSGGGTTGSAITSAPPVTTAPGTSTTTRALTTTSSSGVQSTTASVVADDGLSSAGEGSAVLVGVVVAGAVCVLLAALLGIVVFRRSKGRQPEQCSSSEQSVSLEDRGNNYQAFPDASGSVSDQYTSMPVSGGDSKSEGGDVAGDYGALPPGAAKEARKSTGYGGIALVGDVNRDSDDYGGLPVDEP
jgi:hypothetical protein